MPLCPYALMPFLVLAPATIGSDGRSLSGPDHPRPVDPWTGVRDGWPVWAGFATFARDQILGCFLKFH